MADRGTGVDVDGGQETPGVIDNAGKEKHVGAEQSVGDTVKRQRPDAWVQ
jgi:hypothetical protein